MSTFSSNIYIFELANNHQGSVDHGRKIIDAMANIAASKNIRAAVKFQFRDLDTFIHPAYKNRDDVKHIGRFLSTRLSNEQFAELGRYAKQRGLLVMSTPFDEASVQLCLDLNVDIIKIASCSAQDWPLLEAVAAAKKPVIASTGGVALHDIDKLASFFQNRTVEFALMHCVGVYPTPPELLNMNMVTKLQKRYPGVPIGYSGHEGPTELFPGVCAAAKGATLFERHVGVEAEGISLNAYSMNPEQTSAWVSAVEQARVINGREVKSISESEASSLRSLMRGVYIARPVSKGALLTKDDVFFAMPLQEGQLTSGEFGSMRSRFYASKDYVPNEPVQEHVVSDPVLLAREVLHEARGMISEAGISLGSTAEFELSHHYGLSNFRNVGALIVNVCNREYCKKLIVLVPGQRHPRHMHQKKEEMFELLSGDVEVELDGTYSTLKPGDQLLIPRNAWHSFRTTNGAIFEEISTTHYRGDSYYEDPEISKLDPMQRKTVIRDEDF